MKRDDLVLADAVMLALIALAFLALLAASLMPWFGA